MAISKCKTTYAFVLAFFVLVSCGKNQYLPKWMLGKWETNFNGIHIVEDWQEKDDTFSGRTIWDDGGLNSIEKHDIYIKDGQLNYHVKINDTETSFVCDDFNNDTLIFVNNKNDYPKRIVYTKPVKNIMKVWVDNFQNDSRTSVFYFEKK